MTLVETIKIAADVLTPVAILALGVALLRRIEGVKASVAMQSDFRKRWADQFFDCCQEFLVTLERQLALLTVVAGLKDPNDEFGTGLQKEIASLAPALSELELRIRRSIVFAPAHGSDAKAASGDCLNLVANLLNQRQGNVDAIIVAMNAFNKKARLAHAEMIGIAEQGAQPDAFGAG